MSEIFNPNYNSLPKQVAINKKDIEELKEVILQPYNTSFEYGENTGVVAIPLSNTTIPQDTETGEFKAYLLTADSVVLYTSVVQVNISTEVKEVLAQAVCSIKGPKGDTGEAGEPGEPGEPGQPGQDGTSFQITGYAETTSDLPETGTVGDAYAVGTTDPKDIYVWIIDPEAGWLNLGAMQGPQGEPGQDGSDGITPEISATASVDDNTGTPGVSVTKSGTTEAPTFAFAFSNLKGSAGAPGQDGSDGITPDISATASVDSNIGTPSVTVTKSGTTEAPSFAFEFSNLKGATGETGAQGPAGVSLPGPKGDKGDTITGLMTTPITQQSLNLKDLDLKIDAKSYCMGRNFWYNQANGKMYYTDPTGSKTYKVYNDLTSTWDDLFSQWGSDVIAPGYNIWQANGRVFSTYNTNTAEWDSTTNTWSGISWSGGDIVDGCYIWEDNGNYYYSNGNNQYQLDLSNFTYTAVTWTFDDAGTQIDGRNIWHYMDSNSDIITCYSSSSKQYVLDNGTWTTKVWTHNITGQYVWGDTNVGLKYADGNGNRYYFDISLEDWQDDISTGNYWYTGQDAFYDYSTSKPRYCRYGWQCYLDEGNFIWIADPIDFGLSGYYPTQITDLGSNGEDVIVVCGNEHCKLDLENNKLIPIQRQFGRFSAPNFMLKNTVWLCPTDNLYYIAYNGTVEYYDSTEGCFVLASGLFTEITNFGTRFIWTDGEKYYYSNGTSNQYEFDTSLGEWVSSTLNAGMNIRGLEVWTWNGNIYVGNTSGSDFYILDKTNQQWDTIVWYGLTNNDKSYYFFRSNMATDGKNVYLTISDSASNMFRLDYETSTWVETSMPNQYIGQTFIINNKVYTIKNNKLYLVSYNTFGM